MILAKRFLEAVQKARMQNSISMELWSPPLPKWTYHAKGTLFTYIR
jgi:hypothetical protein